MESIHLLAHAGLNLNLVWEMWEIMKLICSLIHPSSQLDMIWMKNTGLWSRTRVGQTGQTKRMTAYIPAYSGETGTQAPKPPRARKQQASRPDPSPLSCGGMFDIKIAFHLFSLHASASVPLSSGRDLKPPTRTTWEMLTQCGNSVWTWLIIANFLDLLWLSPKQVEPPNPTPCFYCGTSREMQEKKLHSVLRLVLLC